MSLEYRFQMRDDEPVVCECCNAPAPVSEFRRDHGDHTPGQRLLCEFCSTTMASRYNEYPATNDVDRMRGEVWRAAGALFNMLRAAQAEDRRP